MSEVKWTHNQQDAIEKQNNNILVAAAAGSGKTAVLVERIIQKILYKNVDIDKILVVTFTNSAASEMRQRILDALYKKAEENPNDVNLQKQIMLMNKASICTIDSFCMDIIKNYFYLIDLPANFRVGDTTQLELLKKEVLEDLLEEKYEMSEEGFLDLLNMYTSYKSDEPLKELILGLYEYIQSYPFPQDWITKKTDEFFANEDEDFSNTIWGKQILDYLKGEIVPILNDLKLAKEVLEKYPDLIDFIDVVSNDYKDILNLKNNLDIWDNSYKIVSEKKWIMWPRKTKMGEEEKQAKERAKKIRDNAKKRFELSFSKLMSVSSKDAVLDILEMRPYLIQIKDMVLEFSKRFSEKKREKNIVDFQDMEHFALKVLINKDENGQVIPTDIAKKIRDKFVEIAIDEYQDSNLVQEYLLKSISRGNNIFMVGDVKQSIYRFRQARPELFLEKYHTYSKVEEDKIEGLKIQLFKNFRSRKNILDITNAVFQSIMSTALGDIDYEEEEYLNLGADFKENKEYKTLDSTPKLYLIDTSENEEKENSDDEDEEVIEDTILEAKFIASKIEKLINSGYYVQKKGEYKKLEYRDIAILLRSTSVSAPVYEKQLIERKIPVFSDTNTQYIETIEIDTMLSFLRIIDNPMQDIPLVSVLRSSIGGFTDNDLIKIRIVEKNECFFTAMKKALQESDEKIEKILKEKIQTFLDMLTYYKEEEKYLPLSEIVWKAFTKTGYFDYVGLMPNGALRQANLKKLFEKAREYEKTGVKGLFGFITFFEKIAQDSQDLSPAKIIGENDNVVRIMSIHKSKGLEFPVVCLCGLGKKFNLKDLNQKIVFDQDLGIGLNYMNQTLGIEYPTLTKEAIKIKMKKDTLSEEMRILYVALTRAKEKLILTGVEKNIEEQIEKKKMLLLDEKENEKISPEIVSGCKSYLDWLEISLLHSKDKEFMEYEILKKDDVLEQLGSIEDDEKNDIDVIKILDEGKKSVSGIQIAEIKKDLEWKYPYEDLINLPSKTTVTKLKDSQDESYEVTEGGQIILSDLEKLNSRQDISNLEEPEFIKDKKISPAKKGTIMHLCLQYINPKQDITNEDIDYKIEELLEKQILTKEEADTISYEQLYKYIKSDLYNDLKKAKKIYQEMPFYLSVPAKEVYKDKNVEKAQILVQGMIDLFYISENNKKILVDFKTDKILNGQEEILEKRYKKQIELYKRALEESLEEKIDESYIYSLSLSKLIKITGGEK